MADVLVLDDSLEMLQMLRLMLAKHGHTVKTVPTTELFSDALIQSLPQVFLIDVNLIDHDGREICKNLKFYKRTKNIPIILISGDHENLIHYQEYKADAVLGKPFTKRKLLDTISALVKAD